MSWLLKPAALLLLNFSIKYNNRIILDPKIDKIFRYLYKNIPCNWSHIIPRKNTNLACMHGSSLEPAILTAFKH